MTSTGDPEERSVRPTMADVARHAGVALKTVSRVVNDEPGVSPAMAARVTSAINVLGFRRNESAANLRRGRTATLGLVVEDIADPFYAALGEAVEEVALAHGLLLFTGATRRSAEREQQVVSAFCARRVDGLIVVPTPGLAQDYLEPEVAAGTKVVFVDRPAKGVSADHVLADNAGGARAAVAHLVAHGHRKIALLGDERQLFTASERLRGYKAGLKAAGIEFSEDLVVMPVHGEHEAAQALKQVVSAGATGVITGNNRITSDLLRAHKGVPAQALVGFDDLELADLLQPGLTVVAQDAHGMGRRAAELLLERINGSGGAPHRETWPTTLLQRGSGERPPAR